MVNSVGILYICTGRYNQFFSRFYQTSEKFFLPGFVKHYYVWTDNDSLAENRERVTIFHKECEGFPFDSLFRFEMFLQAENYLKKETYLFFFNSNAEFKCEVGVDILPDSTGLVGALWPGKRMKQNPVFYPYERNKRSLAYIPPRKPPYHYYMGGLNGGTSCEYLVMIRSLASNIRKDFENGIIAVVHDESHINAYFWKHPCKQIGKEYCWPEEWDSLFEPKIVLRDKVKVDTYFNKGRKKSFWVMMRKACMILFHAVSWFF